MAVEVVAQKTLRIGVQQLCRRSDGQWFVRIKNRTYERAIPIPDERVELWRERLDGR